MPSKDDSFLELFMDLTNDCETPELFRLWSGVGGVSCVLQRRVWIDMGVYTVYPNMYIVLVAASAVLRKSTAIVLLNNKVVSALEPPIRRTPEKVTPEALIDAMIGEPTTDNLYPEEAVNFGFPDEMSTFINKGTADKGMVEVLIKLYDCSTLIYKTISRGEICLKKPCLGILAATTPDTMRANFGESVVTSGLASRIIFVFQEWTPDCKPVAFPTLSPDKLQKTIKALQQIYTTYNGPCVFEPEAREVFKTYYDAFYYKNTKRHDPVFSGYVGRWHLHLLKLAIVYAASELSQDCGRVLIKPQHINAAKAMLDETEKFMSKIGTILNQNEAGAMIERVAAVIQKAQSISRVKLINLTSHKLNVKDLTEILNTLSEGRRIEQCVDAITNQVTYRWIWKD